MDQQAVKSTADDAALAKLSCVERGYYDDPFLQPMARGATGLVGRKRASSSGAEPIIRRGTHARVMAMDRAIDSFLSLPLSSSSPTGRDRARRQIVVLGSGRDTTYLRYRFGNKNANVKGAAGYSDDDVRWYEVDHPSVIIQKAHKWLPACVPNGYEYKCEEIGASSCDDSSVSSYSIFITPQRQSQSQDANLETGTPMTNYHLVGHDLRYSPSSLFDTLANPGHGYDRSLPTLFILECVMMYLPEKASFDLLHYLAESVESMDDIDSSSALAPLSSSPFVAVALYDPIPSDDRFGRLMIDNLHRAGIGGGGNSGDGIDGEGNSQCQLSLDKTRTLSDQLTKLTTAGFDFAVGCNMIDAYYNGVICVEDVRRAARCEMLDELEEFNLLMKHYCLVVGVASRSSDGDVTRKSEQSKCIGFELCNVGKCSPMGFQEGKCLAMRR